MRKRQGSVLALVLMVFTIIAVLGTAGLTLAINENTNSLRHEDKIRAHYVARAGAETVEAILVGLENDADINKVISSLLSANPLIIEPIVIDNENNLKASVELKLISKNGTPIGIEIESSSTVGKGTSIVSKIVEIEEYGIGLNFVLIGKEIILKNHGVGKPIIEGEILYDENIIFEGLQFHEFPNLAQRGNIMNKTKTINESGRYNRIVLNQNPPNILTIDTEGKEIIEIRVKEFDFGNGTIKINGEGIVNLYIEEDANFSGVEIGSLEKNENLNIYYKGNKDLNINTKLYGNIYVEESGITFNTKTQVIGNIYLYNEKEIKGIYNVGSDKPVFKGVIYAPEGIFHLDDKREVSYGALAKPVDIIGVIIAKTINIIGPVKIKYDEDVAKNFSILIKPSSLERKKTIISGYYKQR